MIPSLNKLDRKRSGSISAGFPATLAVDEPVTERSDGNRSDREDRHDGLPAFLPHQDAQDESAHTDDGEDRPDRIEVSRSGVGDVADATETRQHDPDDR